jgi:exodeoxyribonuclease-1
MIFGADDAPECCQARDLGLEKLSRRADVLKADTKLCQRLISAAQAQKEEYPPSPHVEKQIYDGFPDRSDEQLMNAFHTVPWPKRVPIVEKFQDSRLRKIGRQLIYLERPDLLDEKVRRELDLATANRLLGRGEDISWLTIPAALTEIQAMAQNLSGSDLQHLREHELYLRSRHTHALASLKL